MVKPKHNISQANLQRANMHTRNKTFLWILCIVSILLYSNTLKHGYAYDDFSVIAENRIVTKGISAIPEILSTPYRWGYFRTANDMYRPLSLVMFAAEYQMFDADPAVSHLVNVVLYACCVMLLFIFFKVLFKESNIPAFMAALLFALHPIHTEVVANIKSRDELLCFLFVVSALIFFIKYVEHGKIATLAFGSLLYLLALLSKETAASLLIIIPCIFFAYKNGDKKRSWIVTACSIIVMAVFLSIRYAVLEAHHANDISNILFIDNFLVQPPTTAERYATPMLILGMYLLKLLVPYPLISDYSYNSIPLVNFSSIPVWFSILAYLLLATIVIVRLRKHAKDKLAFGIICYLASVAMFSNLVFLTGTPMAERFLFLPSIGFCWVLAVLAAKYLSPGKMPAVISDVFANKKLLGVLTAVALVFILITVKRNEEWKDNITLFSADVAKAPSNARLNYYTGNEIFKAAYAGAYTPAEMPTQLSNAKHYLFKAIQIYPQYTDALKALGKGYYVLRMFDSSEYYYKQALTITPGDIEAWSDLDVVYFNSKRYMESVNACRKILSIDSTMHHKYKNIGTCFLQHSLYDSAIYYWKTGAVKATDKRDKNYYYRNIANAFRLRGNEDSVKKYESLLQ